MRHPERHAWGKCQVNDVPDAADVLELQQGWVIEVHLALRDAVQEQQPAVAPGQVGDQLGQPAANRLVDGTLLRAPST